MPHIHKHSNHNNNSNLERNFLVRFATYASVSCAFAIIIIKLVAWVMTGSITILATLADSFLDIVSSIVNLLAAKYSMKPADNEHRFGHGKAEDLAVFTQSAFFGASGLFLIILSIQKFFTVEPITHSDFGIIIMLISIFVTTILILFQKYVIKKTNSHLIEADYLHYSIDLLSNIAVIIALILNKKFSLSFIDPLFAFLIAIYVIYSAWKLLRRAFDNLMDREFVNEEKQKIYEIVKKNSNAKGIHDLKTRYAGSKQFIQFHLQLSNDISLLDAHNISDDIEKSLLEYFHDAEIIIHQDPEGADEKIYYQSDI